ncbi:MAG: VPLPA-CTERM sorting domain-containing protein [Methylomonas sp.]|jgi:hypothetical protein
MQSQSLNILTATIASALFSIDSHASIIDVYTQTPVANSFVQSAVLNAPGDSGFNWTTDTDQEQWDYFSVASNVSFNRISWYGTQADGNFAVDLFSATCFSCGATQVNGGGTFNHTATPQNSVTLLPNAGPFSQAQVHETLVSGNLYSYYIDLSSPVTLDHTQTYALSIVNNYSSAPFNWELSNTAGSHVQFNVGQAMFLSGPGTMAFTLTNTAAVPVPASAWLLGSGLVYLLGIARKRNIA